MRPFNDYIPDKLLLKGIFIISLKIYFLYFCLNFIEKIMKKVLALAFIGGLLVVNCKKAPDHSLQDSNTMLEEPEATTVVDSTKAKPATAAAPVAATPAPAAKTGSTAKK